MILTPYTPPSAEPISLTQAKRHLALAVDDAGAVLYTAEDAIISVNITAARQFAEGITWADMVLQVWDMYLDAWPAGGEIPLNRSPVRAVESIEYTDIDGTVSTFASTEYSLDNVSMPGRIVLNYGKSWPSASLSPVNPVKIRFKTGFLVPFSATAATDVISAANHPFVDGDKVRLSVSGGTLPAGLAALTNYFVRDAVAGVSLKLSATVGWAAIDITTAGTGNMFIGELSQAIVQAMLLKISDLKEGVDRNDAAIRILLSMDSVKTF